MVASRQTGRGRSGFFLTTALGTLVVLGSGLEPVHGQPARSDNPSLPPVIIQPDSPSGNTATSTEKPRGSRRITRAARSQTKPAPAPAVAGAGGTGQRDGIDGYVAQSTSTGAKVSTPILQLPRSVSTVTQQEIADRDARSVQEALNYTAGVETYFRQGNLTRENTLIRGFLAFQYLDGLKLHDSSWGYEPYGLQRIDVLKGPAASLYGQGSPGGLWDMTSKRPTDQPFAELLLRAGSYGYVQGGFDVGGPLTPDHSLLYRFVGTGNVGDGEIQFSKNERAYLAPSLTWRPNEDTSITFLTSYQYDPHLTVLQPLPAAGTITPGPNGQFISRGLFLGEPGFHDTSIETVRTGYELNHQFNDVFSFQQNFAYQNIDIHLHEVQSLSTPNTTTTNRFTSHQDFLIDIFQIDNRLKADFDVGPLRHHWLFGADYAAIPNYQGTGTNTASPYTINLYNPVYGQALAANVPITSFRYQDQRQAGVYVQDRVEIGRLSAMFGTRYDDAELGQKTRVLNTATGVLSNPPWTDLIDHKATSNAGLIYNFGNGIAPYVSYSQSFYPTTSGTTFDGHPLVPTTGEQSETGIKYMPPGYNILMSAAVFQITQNNVVVRDVAHTAGNFVTQIGQVQSKGAEFEAKTTNLYGFNISAAYTYLDAKVTSTTTVGGLGKHPVGISPNQASLWSTYKFQDVGPLAGMTLGGGVRWVDAQSGDALNSFAVPTFALFDLMVRYQLGVISPVMKAWDVAFNVKNVADKRYVSSCDDKVDCYYGPGRFYDLTLRARF
jgi:iron complex outermembrane recepter protein